MERTFLATITTFEGEEAPKSKFGLALERLDKSQVYRIYRLTEDYEWVLAHEGKFADYNSARFHLDKLITKDLNIGSIYEKTN